MKKLLILTCAAIAAAVCNANDVFNDAKSWHQGFVDANGDGYLNIGAGKMEFPESLLIADTANAGDKILIPRARIGNRELVDALSAFEVDDVPTYDTVPLSGGLVDVAAQFEQGRIFCVAFTSSSGVRAFAEAHPGLDFTKVRAACIGEKTRATAESLGMPTWVSDHAAMDSLCDLIVTQYATRS